ncbi:hypothetical protein WDU94_011620 [Cyamophila willieti]
MPCITPRLISIFAFLLSFTIVMSLLFYVTDLKDRGPRKVLTAYSPDSDLLNIPQEEPILIEHIQTKYLKFPNESKDTDEQKYKSNINLMFNDMTNGKFIEVGASEEFGSTQILVDSLNWTGLVVEPHPDRYLDITKLRHVHTANICISPTYYPREASFKSIKGYIKITCFPLYSVMAAFKSTNLDLLKLNLKEADYQVLKTLPWTKVCIKVISVPVKSKDISMVTKFLSNHGYQPNELTENTQHYYFSYKKDCPSNIRIIQM